MRTVKEWFGRTDDSVPPRSVKVRVLKAFGEICQCGCGVKIAVKEWDTDHIRPLSEDGENRESNLRPLFKACHKLKTAAEATVRAKVYRVRNRHLGLKKKPSRLGFGRDSKFKRTVDGRVVPRASKRRDDYGVE